MTATTPKSPNIKRLDNMDRMLKEIARQTDAVENERERLAVDRDFWKGRALKAEAERDANATLADAMRAALVMLDPPAPAEPAPEPAPEPIGPTPAPAPFDFGDHVIATVLQNDRLARVQAWCGDRFEPPVILMLEREPHSEHFDHPNHTAKETVFEVSVEDAATVLDAETARLLIASRKADGETLFTRKIKLAPESAPAEPTPAPKVAAKAPAKPKATASRQPAPDHSAIIMSALTGEFQTVLELHASAKAKGYPLGDQSLRYAMTGKPPELAGGLNLRADVVQRDKTLAWKLRQPAPGDQPETDADAPAPAEPDNADPFVASVYTGDWGKAPMFRISRARPDIVTKWTLRNIAYEHSGDFAFTAEGVGETIFEALKQSLAAHGAIGTVPSPTPLRDRLLAVLPAYTAFIEHDEPGLTIGEIMKRADLASNHTVGQRYGIVDVRRALKSAAEDESDGGPYAFTHGTNDDNRTWWRGELQDAAPAPAEPAMVKLYGRLSPGDRIKRDRLLLEALGEEGRTFSAWSSEITARGGDMGPNPQLFLEAAQQRLKGMIGRNHFGGGATFWLPSLAEALAHIGEPESAAPAEPTAFADTVAAVLGK